MKKIKILLIIIVWFVFLGNKVMASDFMLLGESDIRTGDLFELKAVLSSDEPINAVEGTIIFSEDNLELTDLKEGNSLISLWVEKPHVLNSGEIFFSGIIPGGWQGNSGLILNMEFKVKKEGLFKLSAKDVRVLKNDGEGTDSMVNIRPLEVSIFKKTATSTGGSSGSGGVIRDMDAPESFVPQIITNEFFHEGKAVIVFSTQDKASGIDHYEIKEVKYKILNFLFPWKEVESPAVLEDQSLSKTIMVKAVDKEGNERIEFISPINIVPWYERIEFWCIILSVLGATAYLFKKIWGAFLLK